MDLLTLFGLFAVTAMLVCYAFEERSRWFILAFAAACFVFQGCQRGVDIPEDRSDSIQRLRVELRSEDPASRLRAVAQLGEAATAGNLYALKLLTESLTDPDSPPSEPELLRETQERILSALRHLKDPRTTDLLISLHGDPKADVREFSAIASREVEDPRALDLCIAALEDPSPQVARAAAESLAERGGPRAASALSLALKKGGKDGRRSATARALAKLVFESLPAQDVLGLRSSIPEEPDRPPRTPLETPALTEAIETLLLALKDEDREVRLTIAKALMEIRVPRIEPLLTALRDRDPEVRGAAAVALGKQESVDAVEGLTGALTDSHVAVRRSAARSLGQIGDRRAVAPLLAALQADPENLSSEVHYALLRMGDQRAARAARELAPPSLREWLRYIEQQEQQPSHDHDSGTRVTLLCECINKNTGDVLWKREVGSREECRRLCPGDDPDWWKEPLLPP